MKHQNLVGIQDLIITEDHANFNVLYAVMDFCQSDLKKLMKS